MKKPKLARTWKDSRDRRYDAPTCQTIGIILSTNQSTVYIVPSGFTELPVFVICAETIVWYGNTTRLYGRVAAPLCVLGTSESGVVFGSGFTLILQSPSPICDYFMDRNLEPELVIRFPFAKLQEMENPTGGIAQYLDCNTSKSIAVIGSGLRLDEAMRNLAETALLDITH